MGLSFLVLYSKFHFSPSHPMDKHIPDQKAFTGSVRTRSWCGGQSVWPELVLS